MADDNLGTDLFGEPILPRREGPGRPEAVWTQEGSNRALLAFALDKPVKFAASLVGLSVPTFRKVYFSECEKRKAARDKLEFRQLELLAVEAAKGSVAASKELDRRLDKIRNRDLGERVADRGRQAEPKAKAKGKKEEQSDAARGVGGRFGTREPPPRLVN